jgi:preprotein translocase subunit SecF
LLFSIFYLYNFTQRNGDIIYKDVTLTGGTTITIFDSNQNIEKIISGLKAEFPDLKVREISDILTGKSSGFSVTTKAEVEKIKPALEKLLGYQLTDKNSSIEFSGASLSSGFYYQLRYALILSFILMAIVVFAIFRNFMPSLIVVLCAFADIMMTIVTVDLLGIQLSSAGVIAFLMLIGYSVDTDILLTTRLIKKEEGGTINQRIYDAFKTGITMTLTSIAAVAVSLILIYNFSDTLRQIFTILLIGLGFDILNTWVSNASLLKWYMEIKKK